MLHARAGSSGPYKALAFPRIKPQPWPMASQRALNPDLGHPSTAGHELLGLPRGCNDLMAAHLGEAVAKIQDSPLPRAPLGCWIGHRQNN